MNLTTVLSTLSQAANRFTNAAKGTSFDYAAGYRDALRDVARLMEVEFDPDALAAPARPSRGFATVFEEDKKDL